MINTFSKFWYGWEIKATAFKLDYAYAGDSVLRTAILRTGRYSSAELCIEIKRALAEKGTGPFNCAFDRTSKKFIISSPVAFNLLCESGPNKLDGSAFELLGFSVASDKTGSLEYTADSSYVTEMKPQFKLQGVTDPKNSKFYDDAVQNKSTSGRRELIFFGKYRRVDFEMLFITNIIQPDESVIRNNRKGVQDANDFLSWATENGPVEYMPDENDSTKFNVLYLDSTEEDSKGLNYLLKEEYAEKLVNYFRSGKLTWRTYD